MLFRSLLTIFINSDSLYLLEFMSFADFTIVKNQQLLMVRPKGAWSVNTANDFVKAVNEYLHLEHNHFAGVIDLRLWELGTPEALEIVGRNISYSASLGYKLEIHFGQPMSLPVKVSEQQVTPKEISLHQCSTITEINEILTKHQCQFDLQALSDFLAHA